MKNLVIGICDDDASWHFAAEEIIRKHSSEHGILCVIKHFYKREEVLTYGETMDVLFLDIELKNQENGIEIAEKVNRRWEECQIVYLTNYLFYAVDVYETQHTYFMVKEKFEVYIGQIFEKVLHGLKQSEKQLIYSLIKKGTLVLAPEDILYYERILRVTVIETTKGSFEIWDKLDAIMEKLPVKDFVRCHISYIVYFPAVMEMKSSCFLMKNGKEIPISRGYGKAVRQAFMEWALTQRI
ncbi:MAG: response regulator transcription factor [Clostridiales bacterium]|nr:response regulator transcription factor [Clostridiales bacterium]